MSKKKNKQKNNRTSGANKQKAMQKKVDNRANELEENQVNYTYNEPTEEDDEIHGYTIGHDITRLISRLSKAIAPKIGVTKTSLFNLVAGLTGSGLNHLVLYTATPTEDIFVEMLKICSFVGYTIFTIGVFGCIDDWIDNIKNKQSGNYTNDANKPKSVQKSKENVEKTIENKRSANSVSNKQEDTINMVKQILIALLMLLLTIGSIVAILVAKSNGV